MNDIARQLKQHRSKFGQERPSVPGAISGLIFNASQLGTQSKETLLALALESAERLSIHSGSALEDLAHFLSESPYVSDAGGNVVDRSFLTKTQGRELNQIITRLLYQLGEYWITLEGLIVIEFFIRVLRINVTHYRELFIMALPFHEKPIFSRLIQLLRIPPQHPLIFLERVQDTKVGLSEHAFVQRLKVVPGLASLIINGLLDLMESCHKSQVYRVFLAHFLTSLLPQLGSRVDFPLQIALADFKRLLRMGHETDAMKLINFIGSVQFLPTSVVDEILKCIGRQIVGVRDGDVVRALVLFLHSQHKTNLSDFWRRHGCPPVFKSAKCFLPTDQTTGMCILPSEVSNEFVQDLLVGAAALLDDLAADVHSVVTLLLRTLVIRALDSASALTLPSISHPNAVQKALFGVIVALIQLAEQRVVTLPQEALNSTMVVCHGLNPTQFLFLVAGVENRHLQKWIFNTCPGIDADFVKSDLLKMLRGMTGQTTGGFLAQRDASIVFSQMFTAAVIKLFEEGEGAMEMIETLLTNHVGHLTLGDLIQIVEAMSAKICSPTLNAVLRTTGLKALLRDLLGHGSNFEIQLRHMAQHAEEHSTLKAAFDTFLEPHVREQFAHLMSLDVSGLDGDMSDSESETEAESVDKSKIRKVVNDSFTDLSNLEYLMDITELDAPTGDVVDYLAFAVWEDLGFAPMMRQASFIGALSELSEDTRSLPFVKALVSRLIPAVQVPEDDIISLRHLAELNVDLLLEQKSTTAATVNALILDCIINKAKVVDSLTAHSSLGVPPWIVELGALYGMSLKRGSESKSVKADLALYKLVMKSMPDFSVARLDAAEALTIMTLHLRDSYYADIIEKVDRFRWSRNILKALSRLERPLKGEPLVRLGHLLHKLLDLRESITQAAEGVGVDVVTGLQASVFVAFGWALESLSYAQVVPFVEAIRRVIVTHALYSRSMMEVFVDACDKATGQVLVQLLSLVREDLSFAKCMSPEIFARSGRSRAQVATTWLDAAALLDTDCDSLINKMALFMLEDKECQQTSVIVAKIIGLTSRPGLRELKAAIKEALLGSIAAKSFQGICAPLASVGAGLQTLHSMEYLVKCLDSKAERSTFIKKLFNPWLFRVLVEASTSVVEKEIDGEEEVVAEQGLSAALVVPLRLYLHNIYGAIPSGEVAKQRWSALIERMIELFITPHMLCSLTQESRVYLKRLTEEMSSLTVVRGIEGDEDGVVIRMEAELEGEKTDEESCLDNEWQASLSKCQKLMKLLMKVSTPSIDLGVMATVSVLKRWVSVKASKSLDEGLCLLDENRLIKALRECLQATWPGQQSQFIIYEAFLTLVFANSGAELTSLGTPVLPAAVVKRGGEDFAAPVGIMTFMLARSCVEQTGIPSFLAVEHKKWLTTEEQASIAGISSIIRLSLAMADIIKHDRSTLGQLALLEEVNNIFLSNVFDCLSPAHAPIALALGATPTSPSLAPLFRRASWQMAARMANSPADFVYGEAPSIASELREIIASFEPDSISAVFAALPQVCLHTAEAAVEAALWLSLVLVQCPHRDVVFGQGVPQLLKMVSKHKLYGAPQISLAFGVMAMGFPPDRFTSKWTAAASRVMKETVESGDLIVRGQNQRWVVYLSLLMGMGREILGIRPETIGAFCWSTSQIREFVRQAVGELPEQASMVDFWAQLTRYVEETGNVDKSTLRVRRQIGKRLVGIVADETQKEIKKLDGKKKRFCLTESLAFALRSLFSESETSALFSLFFSELNADLKSVPDRVKKTNSLEPELILKVSSLAYLISCTTTERIESLLEPLMKLAPTLLSFFINLFKTLCDAEQSWIDIMQGSVFEVASDLLDAERLRAPNSNETEMVEIFNFPSVKTRDFVGGLDNTGLGEFIKAFNLLCQSIIQHMEGEQVTKFVNSLLITSRCATESLLAQSLTESTPSEIARRQFGARVLLYVYTHFAVRWGAPAIVTTFRYLEADLVSVLRCILPIDPSKGVSVKKSSKARKVHTPMLTKQDIHPWLEVGLPALTALSESTRALNNAKREKLEVLPDSYTVSSDLLDSLLQLFDVFNRLPRIPAMPAYVGLYPENEAHPSSELTKAWFLHLRQACIQVLELVVDDPVLLSFAYSKFLEKIGATREVVTKLMIVRVLHQCWVTHGLALLPTLSDSLKVLVDLLDSADPETTAATKAWILSIERVTGESLAKRLAF